MWLARCYRALVEVILQKSLGINSIYEPGLEDAEYAGSHATSPRCSAPETILSQNNRVP